MTPERKLFEALAEFVKARSKKLDMMGQLVIPLEGDEQILIDVILLETAM